MICLLAEIGGWSFCKYQLRTHNSLYQITNAREYYCDIGCTPWQYMQAMLLLFLELKKEPSRKVHRHGRTDKSWLTNLDDVE